MNIENTQTQTKIGIWEFTGDILSETGRKQHNPSSVC